MGTPKVKKITEDMMICIATGVDVTDQKQVRGFHQGFQTPRNGWKHATEGRVLLKFRGV